jgi:hypothetical protein
MERLPLESGVARGTGRWTRGQHSTAFGYLDQVPPHGRPWPMVPESSNLSLYITASALGGSPVFLFNALKLGFVEAKVESRMRW